MERPYVIIAGPMGAGKSTLVQRLADRYGWLPMLESASEGNPFLERFYADLPRWSLASQAFYLTEALAQGVRIGHRERGVVQDRSVWEHLGIYAAMLHASGHLPDDEWSLLERVVGTVEPLVPHPHAMLYLRSTPEHLAGRIAARGRAYEQELPDRYLADLCDRYERWVDDWRLSPVVTCDVSAVDLRDPEAFAALCERLLEHVDVDARSVHPGAQALS